MKRFLKINETSNEQAGNDITNSFLESSLSLHLRD